MIEAIGTDISPDDLHEMSSHLIDTGNWIVSAAFWCAMCTIEIKRGKTLWVSEDFQCLVYELDVNIGTGFATGQVIEQFPCVLF